MRPADQEFVTILNQDRRALLLHLAGPGRGGQPIQTMDGYVHNPRSEFFYDPYAARIFYDGLPISDLSVQHMWRTPVFKDWYVRNLSVWDGPIIVTDENNGFCPGGCTFCPNAEMPQKAVINTPAYLDTMMAEEGLTSLAGLAELSIVTSLFRTEQVGIDYVIGFIDAAAERGFHGIVNYMTCQLSGEASLDRLLLATAGTGVRLLHLHTVERFRNRRHIMGAMKGERTIAEIRPILEMAADRLGPHYVGYNYVLGMESIDEFAKGLDELYDTGAVPQVNVFIPYGMNFNPKLSKVRRDISGFVPVREFTHRRIEYLMAARAAYLARYQDADPIYTMNNCGKFFQYPGDPKHFHAHHMRFGAVDMTRLRAFRAWESATPLHGNEFEMEKQRRLAELQASMLTNFDEIRHPVLSRALV